MTLSVFFGFERGPTGGKIADVRTSTLIVNLCLALAAAVLASCGKSDSSSGPGQETKPIMPETQKSLSTAAAETKKAVSDAAATAVDSAKTTASDITSKFVLMAKNQGDNVLSSIGQDLAGKANSLVDTSGGNDAVKTNVQSSLTALTNGKDSEALAPAFQLSQGLSLTGPQLQLAKEVGNLASAFVVQRNFSSVSGAQGDVATLVGSLRNGQYAATLSPLKNIMNNASLTADQKQLISSIADKYAPGLSQAAGTVQEGLKSLQGLPGLKK